MKLNKKEIQKHCEKIYNYEKSGNELVTIYLATIIRWSVSEKDFDYINLFLTKLNKDKIGVKALITLIQGLLVCKENVTSWDYLLDYCQRNLIENGLNPEKEFFGNLKK